MLNFNCSVLGLNNFFKSSNFFETNRQNYNGRHRRLIDAAKPRKGNKNFVVNKNNEKYKSLNR